MNVSDFITKERLEGKSWGEVSESVKEEFDLDLSSEAVRSRYRRATKTVKANSASEFVTIARDLGITPNDYDLSGRYTRWEAQTKEGDTIPLQSIRVVFRTKEKEVARIDYDDFVEALDRVEITSPPPENSDLLAEFSFPDLHIGKSSSEEFVEDFGKVFSSLWQSALNHSPSKVVIRAGDDLFNIDNNKGQTTAGTFVGSKVPFEEMIPTAVACLSKAVERILKESSASVELVIVTGNHDEHLSASFYHVLSAYWRNNDRVSVKGGGANYCTVWGRCMIVHLHGDKVPVTKISSYAATKWPREWGKSVFREAHIGHLHKREVFEEGGITIRRMGTISRSSKWAKDRFPASLRSGVLLMWDKERGLVATYPYQSLVDF